MPARDEHRRSRWALPALCIADVLVALDGTVVSVALPSIQDDLDFTPAALQWVVTAYTLALGSFLLLGGRVADRVGPRRTLMAGLAVFSTASLAAGLARAPAALLAARAAAGLGAALAIPASLALTTALFREGHERTRALGFQSLGMDVGMVAGAVLGGVVTSALGWPWVFFLVVPVGAATVALVPRALDDEARRRAPGARLDVPGALTAATGLALLIFALTRAQASGLGAPVTLAALGAAALLLAAFAAIERRAPSPLLGAALLRRPRALAANLAIVGNAGAFGGVLVIGTLYLQRVLGLSAFEVGLAFVPLGVSAGAGGPLAARLVDRFGARRVVVASLLATAACVVALARAPAHGPYLTAVLPSFVISGFTFATAAVPLTAEAVAGAAPGDTGVAAGLFQTFTHAGGAVVLAVLVIGAAARTDAARAGGKDATAALLAGYDLAFVMTAALLVAAAAVVAVVMARVPRARASAPAAAP